MSTVNNTQVQNKILRKPNAGVARPNKATSTLKFRDFGSKVEQEGFRAEDTHKGDIFALL